jgi:hypothetical protein
MPEDFIGNVLLGGSERPSNMLRSLLPHIADLIPKRSAHIGKNQHLKVLQMNAVP